MWVADMDLPSPPQVAAALQERAQHPVYGYTFRPDSYYQAFRDWVKQRHKWEIELNDQRHPRCGACISVLCEAFTEPGDQILIKPVYKPFFQVVTK